MGWWAVVIDEKEEDAWETERKALMENHRHCLCICVDCHI